MKIVGYLLFTGLALLDYLTAQLLIRHWGWILVVFGSWCLILNWQGPSSEKEES
ncbi:MAG: hypothetical protein JJT75_05795 [Opitutales bacterium]|nr:hypothetical protein [Opitutales bacterium]MCH8540358.1 hypothetical protein [Opitutales bacterium]